jgi:sulfonate transport system substrate-binding protein
MITRRTAVAGTLLAAPALAYAQQMTKLKAGMVTGIDQIGLPIALERGFFEKQGLDVDIARPYATGVDALNALQAGESNIVQVGVPMIGAVVRGMDLVALANYSGKATARGSDATMALVARGDSGITKGNLASLKGKKHRRLLRHDQPPLHPRPAREGRPDAGDVTLVNTPPPDMTVALLAKGIDAFVGVGSLADRGAEGRAGCGRESSAAATHIAYVGLQRRASGSWVEKPTATPSRNSSPPSPRRTSGCAPTRSRRLRSRHAGFPA